MNAALAAVVNNDPWLRTDRPQGIYPNGTPLETPEYYAVFANLGRLVAVCGRRVTRARARRNDAFHQIEWFDINNAALVPHNGILLSGKQLYHLAPAIAPNTYSIESYNFIALATCRLPGNSFHFPTMKAFYFFLLHMERSGARTWIRSIAIEDISSGTYVAMACQLMKHLRAHLRHITIYFCDYCWELRCDPKKWRAIRQVRSFTSNSTGTMNIIFHPRSPTLPCDGCRERTRSGGLPQSYGALHVRRQRLAVLEAGLRRR